MIGSNFWKEFKDFALKGNVANLAVAVIIGAAFGSVVNSLVKNILMPLLTYITPETADYRSWHIGRVEVGAFLGELVNFLIIALAMFLVLVKLAGAIGKFARRPGEAEAPKTKECPLCLSEIPRKAVKCAHCTADLPADAPRVGQGTEEW